MPDPNFLPLSTFREHAPAETERRAEAYLEEMRRRRTVREFSPRPVPRGVIEHALLAAGTAPNGANLQPWHFVVVSDAGTKRQIREAAESEEREFYERRAPREWLEALAELGTDARKPFLDLAPYLIAVFEQRCGIRPDGTRVKHYYVTESVGIATGMLVTALHHAGLATLTHTPSPMGFLRDLLGRPENERPFLLLVAGYPAEDAHIPEAATRKKSLDEISSWVG